MGDAEQVYSMKIEYYEGDRGEQNLFDEYWSNQYVSEKHNTDFYLTPDKIGFLYEASHAIGDYIILEIERTDVREQ